MAKGKTQQMTEEKVVGRVEIKAPEFKTAVFGLVGDSPYVQHRFSEKTQEKMRNKQEEGSTGKKSDKQKEKKDFEALCKAATYVSTEGWYGIPAMSFKAAMVRAGKLAGYDMTMMRMVLFVLADGFTADGTPLVRFTNGVQPTMDVRRVRISNLTTDLASRPMFPKGWEVSLRIRFDAEIVTPTDIGNLLIRAGQQVGIGEGRPASPKSLCGMGWGTFTLKTEKE